MALNANFDNMLREYAPNKMLLNELEDLSWVVKKLKKDSGWGLGEYQLPVELSEASRFEWGALPGDTDIPQASYGKPKVTAPKALLGSMIFDQADLERHSGDMKKSFLSILPQKVQQFTERMTEKINLGLLGDGSICPFTGNGTVAGVVPVGKTRATLFTLNEKLAFLGTSTAVLKTGWVRSIDINAGTITIYSAPTGGAAVDMSTHTTALASKVYTVGSTSERATSLVDICFSLANGGQDALYGGTLVKSASPVLQPYFNDLSSATTGAQLISGLYDTMYEVEEMGRGGLKSEVLLPFSAFKAIVKSAEAGRKFEMGKTEVSYGSSAVELTGPNGVMKLRAARGVPTDKAMIVNWDALVLASRGEMIKKANQLTEEYFTLRKSTGYQFIVDKKAEFELIVTNPQKMGGIKISSAVA